MMTERQAETFTDRILQQMRDEDDAREYRRIMADADKKFGDFPENAKRAVYLLRGLGFVLLRENEDATELINEPHFYGWLKWACAEGPLNEEFEQIVLARIAERCPPEAE